MLLAVVDGKYPPSDIEHNDCTKLFQLSQGMTAAVDEGLQEQGGSVPSGQPLRKAGVRSAQLASCLDPRASENEHIFSDSCVGVGKLCRRDRTDSGKCYTAIPLLYSSLNAHGRSYKLDNVGFSNTKPPTSSSPTAPSHQRLTIPGPSLSYCSHLRLTQTRIARCSVSEPQPQDKMSSGNDEGYSSFYNHIALVPELGNFRRFGAFWAKKLHDESSELLGHIASLDEALEKWPELDAKSVLDCPKRYLEENRQGHEEQYKTVEQAWSKYDEALMRYGMFGYCEIHGGRYIDSRQAKP
jgi:hypothetical protein